MLLISNMERYKFVILQHLLSNSHYYASYRQRLDNNKEENERQLKQQELVKAEKKRLEREREEEDKRTSLLDKEKALLKKESDIQGKLVTSEDLLKDGSSKSKKAVEKGDLKGVRCSSKYDDHSHFKIEKLRREVDKVREDQKQVENEKRNLFENKFRG